MIKKKYTKEDIESVYKTHFGEQSLIVLEMDRENNANYTETAIIRLHQQQISKDDIEKWVLSVPRFRDVFIYEKTDSPLRIRLKSIEIPIEFIEAENWEENEVLNLLDSKNIFFDIQHPPLFRIFVFQSSRVQFLVCCYHHLLFDGISIQYAFSKLRAESNFSSKEWMPKVSELSHKKNAGLSFQLQNYTAPPVQGHSGFYYENLELSELGYREIMLSWVQFLGLASGDHKICVGEVFSMRNSEPEAQTALGYFIQTWPLIFDLNSTNLKEDLDRQRAFILSHCVEPAQHFFNSGLFDHCWVVEPEIRSEYHTIFRSKPHYILSLVLQPQQVGCNITFVWNLSKINREAAKEIILSFRHYLTGEPQKKTKQEANYQLCPITELWAEKVKLCPEKSAVKDSKGNSYSYRELDELSDRLAAVLKVDIQEPIGVRTSFSASLIISYLAILKRRAIYVPLDPEISSERLKYILEDTKTRTVISDLDPIEGMNTITPFQESQSSFYKTEPDLNDICYLIYTSGTTGHPKGCAVTHANLCNLFLGTLKLFDFNQEDRWILAHSYGFDFSTWEIWGALLNGASIYIPDRSEVRDSFRFYDILVQEKITILNQTPKSFDNLILIGDSKPKLTHLRYLIFGGDKLNSEKINAWQKNNLHVKAINMYGITETTVHVTFKELIPDSFSNIGNPLPGYETFILNKSGNPAPNGFLGEFYVSGAGVCRGYYNNPELTKEKFPLLESTAYKTGDLGWRMQNDFYYLGRNDRQVKIRGYRIELGEIEFLLQKKFEAARFIVLFIDNSILAAFHTHNREIERSSCKEILPEYATPASFIFLESIPLNVNGKIDEKALIAIFRNKGQAQPGNSDSLLIPYLHKLLGNKINAQKSFIENGGDSISAIRLINLVKKDGYQLTVQELFSAKTLAEISLQTSTNDPIVVDWKKDCELEKFNSEAEVEAIGIFQLTETQKGILFDSLAASGESIYMEQLTYVLSKEISTEKLLGAYQKVMNSLPALRLYLQKFNGDYIWILPKNTVLDIRTVKENISFEELLELDFSTEFDFSSNLIRLTVFEKENGEKHLIWTQHHLLMDGWSLGIFSKLLFDALEGKDIPEQNAYLNYLYGLNKNNYAAAADYWKQRLKDLPGEPLIPYLSVGNNPAEYAELNIKIPHIPLWKSLAVVGITQHTFILTAWLGFLSASFKRKTICPGRVNSLREGLLEEEVGMLIQTLPFPIEIHPEDSFIELSEKVKHQIISDNEHKAFSAGQLEGVSLDLDHIFVFENYPIDSTIETNTSISIGKFREKTAAKWTLICYPKEEGIEIRALFKSRFYHRDFADALLKRFSEFLSHISWTSSINEIYQSLSLQPVSKGQTKSLAYGNILDLFKKDGSKLLLDGEFSISYTDFWKKVDQFSSALKQLGVQKNESLGVDVTSTYHFLLSTLSIWKIGGVACSVDFKYPAQRKEFIWKNASCRFIITEKEQQLTIDELEQRITFQPENASFILHTSGSTGQPKGVIQTEDCLIHLADWTAHSLGLNEHERILALSSFGFDASFHEIILSLTLGATLIEMPYEYRQDIQQIRKSMQDNKVTMAWIPARLLNSILDIDPDYFNDCHTLKQVVTTGEALIIGDALKSWVEKKNIRLFNFYGPTETHVVTCNAVDKNNISKIPDIGFAINNASAGLFDPQGDKVPEGFPGEIWISGPYLAHSYLNDKKLTELKFIQKDGLRWYKTGDFGWFRKDGRLEYLGRIDDQIKIRGYRVEPFEVESLMHNVEGIEQVAIAVDKTAELKLAAFWTGKQMSDSQFRKACAKVLPEYMIPEVQIYLDALPRNINGKIDRKFLLETYLNKGSNEEESMPKTKAFECWVAVLGHTNFNRSTHFQSVGGNSIKLMKMQAWLEKKLHISMSIRELLEHQTLTALEELIAEKESEMPVGITASFPLNPLQLDILITEKGNFTDTESPFLLSFSCKWPLQFDINKLSAATERVFQIYPHLGYAVSTDDNLKNSKWVKNNNFKAFIQSALQPDSLEKGEPLLRIYLIEQNLKVEWHHILLDAVGIDMVMQQFYNAMLGRQQPALTNYKGFFEQALLQNIAKTESSGKLAKIYSWQLSADEKKRLESITENLKVSMLDLLLLLSHSLFGDNDLIAFTDNSLQAGIPGMFTFLNNSKLLVIPDDKTFDDQKILCKHIDTTQKASMVINLMYAPELPISTVQLQSELQKFCKYPYELQVSVNPENIEIQLWTEENNTRAEEKSILLDKHLGILLKEVLLSALFRDFNKIEQIHFEDFDF